MLLSSSIHQDVPLYSLDEFKRRAPEEARTEDVLSDEHQLMLNRLSFELAERQRCPFSVYHMVIFNHSHLIKAWSEEERICPTERRAFEGEQNKSCHNGQCQSPNRHTYEGWLYYNPVLTLILIFIALDRFRYPEESRPTCAADTHIECHHTRLMYMPVELVSMNTSISTSTKHIIVQRP